MFARITPLFIKAQLTKQNYNYAAACSISLGCHRKRLIHNWVWRLTRVEEVWFVLLYSLMVWSKNQVSISIIEKVIIILLILWRPF